MNARQEAALVLAQLAMQAHGANLGTTEGRKATALALRGLFLTLGKHLQPALVIEAGAHDAGLSARMRRVAPAAKIRAFEANPHNHAKFTKRYDYAEMGVDYRLCAIADRDGPVTFRVLIEENGQARRRDTGRSSLLARSATVSRYEEVTVPALTLDAAGRDVDGRVALWVDVEGAAKQVLSGAEAVLARTDLLMIEVETRPFWDGQWLAADVCAHLLARGLVPVARDFEFPNQFNMLWLSPDALLRPDCMAALDAHHAARAVSPAP